GPVSFGPTGGWQIWDNVTIPDVILNAGPQILRMAIDSAGWNLNWIEASLVAAIVSGDFNKDGDVDQEDFGQLQQ
ncbi:MAG: 1,4-beta-xylanase, partial [Planctomycetota bacterium]